MVRATAAEPVLKLQLTRVEEGTSGHFQVVSFNPHRDCALDALDRDYQMLAAILVQDAFHAIERTAANAHPLAAVQKGKDAALRIALQQTF